MYVLVASSGPDHHKNFRVQVRVSGEVMGEGEGPTKKEAEEAAARAALAELAN